MRRIVKIPNIEQEPHPEQPDPPMRRIINIPNIGQEQPRQ